MTNYLARAFAASVLLLATATATSGQDPRTSQADSLLNVALSEARAGDTTKAISTLERALRVAPRYAPAHFHRGLLLSRTSHLGMRDVGRRSEAYKAINLALRYDRDNPFYLMELGRIRLKTPLLRVDAERLFRKAVAAAEKKGDTGVLAEVHTELGQIYERRYLTMANRHNIVGDINVFSAEAALAEWQYSQDFLAQRTQKLPDAGEIDRRKAEQHLRLALSFNPAHLTAATSLLGLLYDVDRFEEMVLLARETLRHEPNAPRILMALGLGLHRMDRDAEAKPVFEQAIALLSPDERADMLGLQTVLRKDAASSYTALGDRQRDQTDSTFWAVADPLRLTAINEAQIEFYARVAYADLRFSSPEFGIRGWDTDRGHVHIRYGHPPVVATFAPGSDENTAFVTTLWWYPESRMRFVFRGPPAMNAATFAGEFRSYAEDARYKAPLLFTNLEPRLRVDSVPVQIARFRGSGDAAEVAIYADIPTGTMLRGIDVAQGSLETGFFLTDEAQAPIDETRDSAIVTLAGRDRVAPRSWVRHLPPGDYAYRVEAREAASGRSARARAGLEVPRYPAGELLLSDILVARRIVAPGGSAGTARRSELLIVPNASLTFAPDDTMHLYWEVYGATPDSTGTASLEVAVAVNVTELTRAPELGAKILGGIADAIGISEKGDDRILLRYRFDRAVSSDSDRIPSHLALKLDNAPPGKYLLHLTIKDLVADRTTSQTRTITIPRP